MDEKCKQLVIKLIKNWEIFIISALTIIFGIALLVNPQILLKYDTIRIFQWLMNPLGFGVTFILVGLFKVITIFFNKHRILKVGSISLLVALWLVAGATFHLSNNPTSAHLFCYANALVALGALLSEVFE